MQSSPSSPEANKTLTSQLIAQSRAELWDVYSYFQWPESIAEDAWCMPPELMSLCGTEAWDTLTVAQQKRLSLFEIGNFFSLTLQGERPLVAGMSDLLYSNKLDAEETEYLHHFIDEENKHMTMFGMFCRRYVGKIYPEKKLSIAREYAKGEAEVMFFIKVMVVEEIGDYFNVKMMIDKNIHPIVKELNWVHHRDESRHLGFGREITARVWEKWHSTWTPEVLARFRLWVAEYVKGSWNDFYNPATYKDAGLANAYDVRTQALAHPASKAFRERASKKLINYFVRTGILESAIEL